MKILQLSDLHIGKRLNKTDEDENFKKIRSSIIAQWGDNDEKPLILITGDITNSGTDNQYEDAAETIKSLQSAGFEILSAPGNHDYGFLGNIAVTEAFERFKEHLYPGETVAYPVLDRHEEDDFTLALIGLDSMQGECRTLERFLADGELGQPQREKLEEMLKELEAEESQSGRPIVKLIYLHHHPFLLPEDKEHFYRERIEKWVHALDDGDELMTTIRDKRVDALVFGHDHDHLDLSIGPDDCPSVTEDYDIQCILSCGKSTDLIDDNFPSWLIEIDKTGVVQVEDPGLS